MATKCPHCDTVLTSDEVQSGFCEGCGKKFRGATRSEPTAKETAGPTAAPQRSFLARFGLILLILLPCGFLGAFLGGLVDGFRSNGPATQPGLMAGIFVGILIAYALGVTGKKPEA